MPINMRHFRFRNTLEALRECFDALDDLGWPKDKDERIAVDALLRLCADMVRMYSEYED